MAFFVEGSGSEATEKLAEMFGPEYIDQFIRQAVQYCWMALPEERKSPDELERQIRRLVDRALKDFQDDRKAFGQTRGRATKDRKRKK